MATSFMFKIKKLQKILLGLAVFVFSGASFANDAEVNVATAISSMQDTIFQTRLNSFDSKNYNGAVSAMFRSFEKKSGHKIKRGAKGKVGLKIYTNSGAGLATPKNLVDAVIFQLVKRGYKPSEITIVDMSERKMRACGYLPKLTDIQNGATQTYNGANVVDIESGNYFDKRWYYDNPLTPKNVKTTTSFREVFNPELRKSYLPVPLFLTVDFWINLPVITDMEGLGICASLGNMSIWNMSNNERFLKQPANASMAAAEVCAIPEMRETNLFTIISYEHGQFVGGSVYNARFSFSENMLMLSSNPVILDYIAWQTINKYRRANRFKLIDPEPPILNYARQLKIGDYDIRKVKKINVPYKVR